ncbi:MAG: betaine/proline/choline family ABC transporter ATP-binding protein [Pseudomonadota bacterium]
MYDDQMPTESPDGSARQVKLSCRALWKVFGPRDKTVLDSSSGSPDTASRVNAIRSRGHTPAVSDVSFDIFEGEIFVLMGLSGSGKSTVLRCLSSLTKPTAGEVIFEGRDLLSLSDRDIIDVRRRKIGMVFQAFGLLPHLTVLENVAFPLKIQGMEKATRLAKSKEYIELVGLEGREHAMPDELSGGQQQRVGIARSLAAGPDLWFLDEPFSALDPLIRRQMQDEFVRLQNQLNKTIVFVTHDFLEALKVADRIAIMKDGQIVQLGTPADLVLRPATKYVSEFTSDVPLTRVLKVRDAMDPATGDAARGAIAPEATLEDVIRDHDLTRENVAVVGADGQTIGCVTAKSIMATLHDGVTRESQVSGDAVLQDARS